MLTNQIAAGITAVVLAVSGVALTAGDDSAAVEAGAAAQVAAESSTAVTVDDSTTTTAENDNTSTTVGDTTSTTIDDTTSTTVDDDSTSTTTPDDDDTTTTTTPDDSDARQVVELGVRSYAVGDAGTVVMDGDVLVGVTVNAGWTFEVDESDADRVRVHFENGEAEAEFDLQVGSRLEITIGS